MVSLDQILTLGQRLRIESLNGADSLAQRLMEMGVLEGEEVELIGFAPFGDPIEIMLRGYRLCLRKSEAAKILVTPL